jgi:hypothetical protein
VELPSSLRTWFVAHSLIDVAVAIPLLVAPAVVLEPLGWTAVDPVTTRLVGAALLAIGLQSFFGRNEGFETYRAMLRLKVIWSMTAVGGLLAGIAGGAPTATWAFLAIFLAFLGVWSHYAIRLKQRAAAPADDEEEGGDDNAADEDSASI